MDMEGEYAAQLKIKESDIIHLITHQTRKRQETKSQS